MDLDATLTTVDVCQLSGATFRQVDYWVRSGLLRPLGGRGSGDRRRWTPTQAVQVRLVRVLADMGAPAAAIGAVVSLVDEDPSAARGWLLIAGRVTVRRDRWGHVERRWEGEVRRWEGEPGEGWLVNAAAAFGQVERALDGAVAGVA